MIDEGYVNELIDDFFDGDQISVSKLNEIAASLADPHCRAGVWNRLLEESEDLRDPEKREALRIAVFELLAEPPVSDLWLEALPRLLADPKRYWIVCGAYINDRNLLAEHLEMLRARFEGTGNSLR